MQEKANYETFKIIKTNFTNLRHDLLIPYFAIDVPDDYRYLL